MHDKLSCLDIVVLPGINDKEPDMCGCMWGLNEVALTVSASLPCCDIVAMVMWDLNTGGELGGECQGPPELVFINSYLKMSEHTPKDD